MQQRRDSGRKEIEGKRTTCQKEIQQMGLQMVKGKAEHDALTKQASAVHSKWSVTFTYS